MSDTMTLMQAHQQWASRPADERMPDVATLHARALSQKRNSVETDADFSKIRVEASEGDLFLTRGSGGLKLSNWAFGQLSSRVGAPAEYLASLDATLAAQNLNHGLAKRVKEGVGRAAARILFNAPNRIVRSLTTDAYERIWNVELAERLLGLQDAGWTPATPDFNIIGEVFPSLYLGERDMFAFMRLPNQTIEQPINSSLPPMYKGYICWNSEVGSKKIGGMGFLYNGMCGNHIIWGARDVFEFEARHVGNVRDKLQAFAAQIREYARKSLSEDQAVIKRASSKLIAATKEEVLDLLFGKRSLNLSRKTLEGGFDAVKPDQDGDARTVWGMVQGLTRYSQEQPNADARTAIDRSAGKLLDMSF